MIINLRGTHGSGKSTVVKSLLVRYGASPLGTGRRPDGYRFTIPWLTDGRPVYVVGSYETACGGCDGIQPYGLIWPRVQEYAAAGHVLFEGAMVSSSYGNIGRASEAYGDDFVFGFLDTPLDVCLARIQARRDARGDVRPMNPTNTRNKYQNVLVSISKIKDVYRRRVVMIDHTQPVPQVLGLLHDG